MPKKKNNPSGYFEVIANSMERIATHTEKLNEHMFNFDKALATHHVEISTKTDATNKSTDKMFKIIMTLIAVLAAVIGLKIII